MSVPVRLLAILALLPSTVAFAVERPRLDVELVATVPSLGFFSSFSYAPLNDSLIFRAGPVGARELYRFDGISVSAIADPYTDLAPAFRVWAELNNELYFSAGSPDGSALYKTDGSSIQFVADFNPSTANDQSIADMFSLGEHVFVRAVGPNGTELFRTDGTTTTEFDLMPGPGSSNPGGATLFGGELLFSAVDNISSSRALYRTSGGAPERLGVFGFAENLSPVRQFQDHLYWTSGSTLYSYDGNSVSSALEIPGIDNFGLFHASEDFFVFSGRGPNGWAAYTWDGTTVREFLTGSGGDFLPFAFHDEVYFELSGTANDGFFKTDGTQVVEILGAPGNTLLQPAISEAVEFNDQLIFRSYGPAGQELYRLGSGNVAELIEDINPSGDAFFLSEFTPVEFQGNLYFRAISPNGVELYKTDGTSASIALDLAPGPASSDPQQLGILGDLPFLWFDATFLPEPNLHLTDGESAATFASYFPQPGTDGTEQVGFVQIAGETYFFAASGNIYRLTVVPEPASSTTFFLGAAVLTLVGARRKSCRSLRRCSIAETVC